jgi:hypothetical protein
MKARLLTVLVLLGTASAGFGQESPRKRVADLVGALERDKSAVIKLVQLTGHDFGLRPALWKKWLDRTTDKQLAQILERVCREEELDEEWGRFAQAIAGLYLGGLRDDKARQEAARAEWEKVQKESREPEAWGSFSDGIGVLTSSGDRAKAAKGFREVLERTPLSHYANEADELALLLEAMADEDRAWVEPRDVDQLNLEAKIRYYIYHLRNVQAEQFFQPGMCHVLSPGLLGEDPKAKPNAAILLRKIGKDAIPALVELLDDRRPIRSVGYWRDYWPTTTLLRYQDAAIQILDVLLPAPLYQRGSTAAYLSNESPEVRYQLIARLREWHRACQGKSEPEKLWIAVKMKPGIHPTIILLRKLAKEQGQAKEVLLELHALYQNLHRLYRPFLAELLAELGDQSKVQDVLTMLAAGEFEPNVSETFPDDSALALNARDAATRLLERFGKGPNKSEKHK